MSESQNNNNSKSSPSPDHTTDEVLEAKSPPVFDLQSAAESSPSETASDPPKQIAQDTPGDEAALLPDQKSPQQLYFLNPRTKLLDLVRRNLSNGLMVFSIGLTGLAVYFGYVAIDRAQLARDESRRLQLLQNVPQISYGWRSNYLPFMVAKKPMVGGKERVPITGVLSIENRDTTPITNIVVRGAIGIDDHIARYPYTPTTTAISTVDYNLSILNPHDPPWELHVLQDLFANQHFDWIALLSRHEDRWVAAVEKFQSANKESTTFALPDELKPCTPVISRKNIRTRILYGRFMVQYSVDSIDYSNVLTLVLGGSQPANLKFGIWLSHIAKQPYTRITSFGEVNDYLRVHQSINNNEDELNSLLDPDRRFYSIRVVDTPTGGEQSFGFVHQSNKPFVAPDRDTIFDTCDRPANLSSEQSKQMR